MELVFLGTGTSAGVPMIGCDCEVCTSRDPRDKRSRASVLIRYPRPANMKPMDEAPSDAPVQVLIDTSPEIRGQMVKEQVKRIDGVFFTHAHADHIFGIDDLRRFNAVMKTHIDLYAEHSVAARLQTMFQYIFEPHKNVNKSFIPQLVMNPLDPEKPIDLFGGRWTPLRLLHGRLPILGFRVDSDGKSVAYCTDVSSIPPETYPLLDDLDVLVIDALRFRHHPTHMTVDQALEVVDQVKPRRAYFTHMAHEIKHADVDPTLPEHVALSYDGLTVTV